MIEPEVLVTAVVYGSVIGAVTILMAGVRRIAWRHAAIIGLGNGIVFAALWAAMNRADPGTLVLVGALGGALAQRGWERGERERRRISDEITAIRSAPPV